MKRLAFVAARAVAVTIYMLTWAYGVMASSSFAFDMFVKPQLSPALTAFVTWHSSWLMVAYGFSAVTLIPTLRRSASGAHARAAQLAAWGYVLVMAASALWMSQTAYLASIGSGQLRTLIVPGALIPVAWLAIVDHLNHDTGLRAAPRSIDQRGLWWATSATAVLAWTAHILWSWVDPSTAADWGLGAIYALALDLALAHIAYLTLTLAATSGAAYAAALAGFTVVVSSFAQYVVLPTLGFSPDQRAIIAWPCGIAMAGCLGGLRLSLGASMADGVMAVFGARINNRGVAAGLAIATVIAGTLTTGLLLTLDWAFVLRQAIAVVEACAALMFLLAAFNTGEARAWSVWRLAAPALVVSAILFSLPWMQTTQRGVERAIAMDPLARVAAGTFLSREPAGTSVVRQLLDVQSADWSVRPSVPPDAQAPVSVAGDPPHVFVIVLDSLRRDYLSPYNPAVTFTPAIDAWARESFVFRNAFTPYGGTALAMPSLWAGRGVPHGWARILPEINRLEMLINTAGYDFLVNDHTVREHLRPGTRQTFLNPFVSSPQTDLCQNISAIEAHLRTRTVTTPVFAFMAPMNVHILNTRVGTGSETYPGFHPPYAAQLEKADACFGQFIAGLKEAGLYDHSIIVLTSDHGDSLGEGGRWGHQAFLYPEIVRIPLLISLPAAMRTSLTTDLGRVAMLTDVTPTLMSLIGSASISADPPMGSTLFVPRDQSLRDRRRNSVMLMSSYGPAFGLLRRGNEMYMSDLASWQESAFALGAVTYQPVPLTDGFRRLSQAALAEQVGRLAREYGGK